MGSGFVDCVFLRSCPITVDYNSSYIGLFLNDVCLMHLYDESLTNLRLTSTVRVYEDLLRCQDRKYRRVPLFFCVALVSNLLPSNDSFSAICCNGN